LAVLALQWIFSGLFSSISEDKKLTSDPNRIISKVRPGRARVDVLACRL
jgi:hypothetical protein